MNLVVNGSAKTVPEGTLLDQVIASVRGEVPARGIAVAVNGEVVPRIRWTGTEVKEGDRVEILTAVAGG